MKFQQKHTIITYHVSGSQAFGNFLKHVLVRKCQLKRHVREKCTCMEAVDTTHRVPGYSTGLGSTTRIKSCTF